MSQDLKPPQPAAASPALDAARRALEDLSRHARTMVETAHDAVVTIDQESVVLDWNRSAERMFGWKREEAVGRIITDLIVPPQHREAHHRGLQRFLAERTPGILNRRVETSAMDREGREFDVELAVWPVETGAGYTFSAFVRDISDRKRAEEAMRKSEEKYRAVVENAHEGIIVSQDGMLKFLNPRALQLTGRTLEEALSLPFIEMVHPEDRARVYGNYLRRIRGEQAENFYNFRVQTSGGDVRWLQISAIAIDWEGRPATLNFLADVTQQLALQESLRASLAEREAILENTAVGIMFIQGGRIHWINDALEQSMLGWSDGELIGRTGEAAFSDHGDWSRFLKECLPALERTGSYAGDWRVRRKDGSPWWCHMSAKAMDPQNLGKGTMWFFLDISTRKRAEEEAQRVMQRERELADLKTRFVSVASHEFRTPLATILSSIELIDDFGPDLPISERQELARIIKGAVARMTSMIEKVMLIGRAESNALEFRPAPLDAESLAQQLTGEARRAAGNRCPMNLVHQGTAGRRMLDEDLLAHVLINLLTNAAKYSPAGSPVEMRMEVSDEALTFVVSDRGIGIPEQDQARLFESFHRARNVGNIEGTGLGLAIVKQCAELHGGSVAFTSAPGQGSTFTVVIPAPRA